MWHYTVVCGDMRVSTSGVFWKKQPVTLSSEGIPVFFFFFKGYLRTFFLICKTRWCSRTFGVWICVLVVWFNSWISWISMYTQLLYVEWKFLQVSGYTPHAFFPKPLIFNSGLAVTWRQDNYGCEQCIFFLCHLQLSNAFIKIKHGSYEFIWDTWERKKVIIFFKLLT